MQIGASAAGDESANPTSDALLRGLAGLATVAPPDLRQAAVDLIVAGFGVPVGAYLEPGATNESPIVVASHGNLAAPRIQALLERIAEACFGPDPAASSHHLPAASSDGAAGREGAAYLAVPVIRPDGLPGGALCAIGEQHRTFTPPQRDALAVAGALLGSILAGRSEAPQPATTALETSAAAIEMAQLRDERDLLQTMIDAVPDFIHMKSLDGRYRRLNGAWATILGLPNPAAGIGARAADFFSPERAAVLATEDDLVVRTGQPLLNVLSQAERSAEERWVLRSKLPVRDGAGQIIGTVGIVRDVTERKLAEDALATERDLLQTLLDTIPDPVFVKDRTGAILRMNKACLADNEIVDPAAMLGQPASAFLSADYLAEFGQSDRSIIETKQARLNGLERYEEAGQVSWYLMSRAPWCNADDEVIGLIGTYRDITPLRDAEAALQRERDVLETLLDALPDAVFIKDRESRFVRVNAAAAASYDVAAPAEVIGKTDLDIFPAAWGQELFAAEQQMMAAGESRLGVLEQHGADPETATWRVASKVPLRDAAGNVSGLVGISRDVTELQRAERALRAERDLLETVLDVVPDNVFIKGVDGRFLRINQAGAKMLGLADPAMAIGHRSRDFWDAAAAALLEADDRTLAETGQAIMGRLVRRSRPDEAEKQYLFNKVPLQDETGRVVAIVGASTDITALKAAEAALERERDLLQLILDTLPDNVYLKDPAGSYLLINQAAARYLGLDDATTAIGRPTTDLWPSDLATRFQAEDAEVLRGGTPLSRQIEGQAPDGSIRDYLYTKVPVRDEAGAAVGIVAISTDVTIIKEAERQLAEALAKEQALTADLEQLSRAKSGFLAMLTHEFRTPLTSIQGYADLLHGFTLSPEEMHTYAGEIVTSAQRLTRLTNELLELDRIQARRIVLSLAPTDLDALVTEVVNLLRPTATGDNWQLALDPALPPIVADADRLIQVLTNIMGNAIKYSPEGGTLTIATWREGNDVLFSVRDDGVGIPPHLIEQVFEPYVRIEDPGTRRIVGTGLGLPIARELVVLHGGHVWAESTAGQGTIFMVRLPIAGPDDGVGSRES